MPCASSYISYRDLGKPLTKFRACKAYLASQPLWVKWRVRKGCWMDGMTLPLLLELGLLPLLLLYFDLEGKDRIQCQDVLIMVQILGEYLIRGSYVTFCQLRIWSVVFCDTTIIKKALLSCYSSCC